jgi:hypothetical protein
MKDIVEQLREWSALKRAIDHDEAGRFKLEDAIAEIERLRAERDELRAICGKFVRHWDEYIDDDTNGLIEALESIIDDARRAAGRGPEAAP